MKESLRASDTTTPRAQYRRRRAAGPAPRAGFAPGPVGRLDVRVAPR